MAEVDITERDRSVLRFVAEKSMATSLQIKERFFPDSHAGYRRIRHLISIGLLKVLMVDEHRNRVLGITPLGIEQIKKGASSLSDLSRVTPRYYSSVSHDLLVNEVTAVLEQVPVVTNVVSETMLANDLRKKYGRNARVDRDFKLPDAAIRFSSGLKEHLAAVEVELTRKSKKRLERTFELFITGSDFTIALFVAKDGPLLNQLLKTYERVLTRPALQSRKTLRCCYFVTLDDIKKAPLDAVFKGLDRSWTFRELENQTEQGCSVTDKKVFSR